MSAKNEKPTVRAVYIGRRLWGEKMVQVFLSGEKERGFTGIKWVVIGRTYLLYKDQCPKQPECVPDLEAPAREIERWEVAESLALQEDKRRKMAKRFSSDPRYLADFPNLQRICQGLNGSERAWFVEFLVDKLSRERFALFMKKTGS